MDLSAIQAECGRLLNDPNNTRWTASVLTTRINLAQVEVQGYTRAVKTSETLTPTADTEAVTLDSDTINIIRATIQREDGDVFPLEGVTREELDYRWPNWKNWTAGEPVRYYYDASNQQINLVPKPNTANAITNGLTVWEIRKPADLSDSTDIPFDSNNQMVPYHMAIVHWVVAQCWMDEGTPEALAKAKFHKTGLIERPGEYEKQIMRILDEFDTPDDIPARILWRPQGGRVGSLRPTKSDPLRF